MGRSAAALGPSAYCTVQRPQGLLQGGEGTVAVEPPTATNPSSWALLTASSGSEPKVMVPTARTDTTPAAVAKHSVLHAAKLVTTGNVWAVAGIRKWKPE